MEVDERQRLKNKIGEISKGFQRLTRKIDGMPQSCFENIDKEIDEFRFKYAKVLNLSPDAGENARRVH